MNKQAPIEAVAERLRSVADSTPNPAVAKQAARLIERLNAPVRVVLMGAQGPEKVKLLNALSKEAVLSPGAAQVTSDLRFGPRAAARVTHTDGSSTLHDGEIDDEVLADAIYLEVELPLPVLREISLLNLVLPEAEAPREAAMQWAAQRCDIALWCSHDFGREDRLVWSAMADGARDHGYLVLTGCSPDQAGEIKARHRSEFVDVYSIALDEADDPGIAELYQRIARDAELGRRADADGAHLFLRTHEPRGSKRTRPMSRPRTRPRGKPRGGDTNRTLVAPAELTETLSGPTPEPLAPAELTETLSEPTPEPLAPDTDGDTENGPPKGLCGVGFGYLRERGQALLAALQSDDAPGDAEILAHCSETLSHLSTLVASHEEASAAEDLADQVMEAENLVVLLESEKGDDAAADALSILLQIRREFEAILAA